MEEAEVLRNKLKEDIRLLVKGIFPIAVEHACRKIKIEMEKDEYKAILKK